MILDMIDSKILKSLIFILLCAISSASFASPQDSIGVTKVDETQFVQYLVTPGETIYRLSTNHKVSIEQLMTDNPELVDGLKVGQVILLRNYRRVEKKDQVASGVSQFETKKIKSAPRPDSYEVQPGDTYYGLSRKYNVPLNDLLKWNGAELKAGQVINVKEPDATKVDPVKATEVVTETKKVENKIEKGGDIISSNEEALDNTDKEAEELISGKKTTEKIEPEKVEKVVISKPKEVKAEEPKVVTETKVVKKVEDTPEVEDLLSQEEIYEFNQNMEQVLIVPFDPHLYWSDADDEIMRGSNLKTRLEVRKIIRRRLNALLDPMGYENIYLMGGRFRDTLTDLNKIYSSVSYEYQNSIVTEQYKKSLGEQEQDNKKDGEVATKVKLKNKFNKLKDKVVHTEATEEENVQIDKSGGKYFGVVIKDPKFFEYFKAKYSIDYYLFINQFEVITDYEHCLDRTTENYRRYFIVHYSIFDVTGNQVAGNKLKVFYDSNSNKIDRITGDNLQKMADRVLIDLPAPK